VRQSGGRDFLLAEPELFCFSEDYLLRDLTSGFNYVRFRRTLGTPVTFYPVEPDDGAAGKRLMAFYAGGTVI